MDEELLPSETPSLYPVQLEEDLSRVMAAIACVLSRHPEAIVLPFECPIRRYVSWAVARYEERRWVIDWWGVPLAAVPTELRSREARENLARRMIVQGVHLQGHPNDAGYRVVPDRQVVTRLCPVCQAELVAHDLQGPHCPRVVDREGRALCPSHAEEQLPGYLALLAEYDEWRRKRKEAFDALSEPP